MSRVKIEAWPSVSALVPKDVASVDQFQKMEAMIRVVFMLRLRTAMVMPLSVRPPPMFRGTCTMGDNHVPLSL